MQKRYPFAAAALVFAAMTGWLMFASRPTTDSLKTVRETVPKEDFGQAHPTPISGGAATDKAGEIGPFHQTEGADVIRRSKDDDGKSQNVSADNVAPDPEPYQQAVTPAGVTIRPPVVLREAAASSKATITEVEPTASAGVAASLPSDAGASQRLPEDIWEEAVVAQARKANVIIEVDRLLGYGQRGEARLMVSRADLRQAAAGTPEATVLDRNLPVTHSVRAQAHSRKLKVSPEGFSERTLVGSNAAIWTWEIEGSNRENTDATLTIDLEHRIIVDGRPIFIPVQTFPQTITIRVGLLDRLVDWTAGLGLIEKLLIALTAVVVAGGGVLVAVRATIKRFQAVDETT